MDEIVIRRREIEKWVPVWYYRAGCAERIRAIAGNPSRTGKTVRIRFKGQYGDQMERSVSPKNLEPRGSSNDGEVNDVQR
jgi:hypothetical protein